ncbi:hypothetical protein QWZ08_24845 [Ferruginibacter paludis]|uniref:hypothetical protein n=1 Tax=Ferruginibacter paludis TaxID=1310417 RepID=UPI0025B4F845|nr:hypothetical protein [Ferruginibacter paludis]MDN3658895.1 hypothetical protein [Ferruginibacter paludis]
MNLKQQISRNLSNIPGWRTNRKVIVIESDDWGSIRMPSLEVLNRLLNQGLDLLTGDSARYNQNDALETSEDMAALFEVLTNFKDFKSNHPVITPVCVVANPDFEKIKADKFNRYYWEPFTQTLKRNNQPGVINLYNEGIANGFFLPQFHGREHLNVAEWMRALQQNDKEARIAFNDGVWGFNNKHPNGVMFQAAFDLPYLSDLGLQHEIIESGLTMFEELFGYKATYFVPPNGPFNNSLEETAAANGIKYMFASKIQTEVLGEGKTKTVFHWLAQKNKWGQLYMVRNAFFEPNQKGSAAVNNCLQEIDIAFKWGKPAVISTHRANFIGSLHIDNRTQSLRLFKELLANILKRWPEAEFMSSDQLGSLIDHSTK